MLCRTLLAAFCLALAAIGQQPALLGGSGIVEGRVVDMRGEGVPAARVRIVSYDDPSKPVAQGMTDGEGCFRIAKVPDLRTLQVRATADGLCEGIEYLGFGSNAQAVEVTMHHAVVVRGTLKNRSGEPVPDASVRAEVDGRSLSQVRCDARTDRDGRFELPAVPLGPMEIAGWVEGEGLAWQVLHVAGPCEVGLQPNQARSTELKVEIAGLTAGSPPVRILLLPYHGGSMSCFPPPLDHPAVDAEGRWQLANAPDWDYTLIPDSTGFAFEPSQIQVKAGKGPHTIAFTATPLGDSSLVCRASVRDEAGKPMAGLPFRMRAPASSLFVEATSDDEGRIAFASQLAKGTEAVVYTTHEEWTVDQPLDDDAHVDRRSLSWHRFRFDPAEELTVRVVPACSVQGRLLLADGRPAAFVSVELQESSSNRMPKWMTMSWATTDRDGAFRFVGRHHLADPVRLHVEGRAGSLDGEPFDLAQPGSRHVAGDLRLCEPATIEGVVRDEQQRPVPGACVWLRDWDFDRNNQASGSVVEVLTDRDGRYRFVGVPVGGAYLQCFLGDSDRFPREKAVEPFEVEAGKAHTFDLVVKEK